MSLHLKFINEIKILYFQKLFVLQHIWDISTISLYSSLYMNNRYFFSVKYIIILQNNLLQKLHYYCKNFKHQEKASVK